MKTGMYPSLCNLGLRYGVISGGKNSDPFLNDHSEFSKKVQRIDIVDDEVEDLPDLNLGRRNMQAAPFRTLYMFSVEKLKCKVVGLLRTSL